MIKQIKLLGISLALMLTVSSSSAFAANVVWTDWSSITTGANGSGTGAMTFGSETVNVSLSGPVDAFSNGTEFFAKYPATYANLNPSDLIREWSTGTVKLTFSESVVNPYIALVSVGRAGAPVNYVFNNPFKVISSGSNDWGYNKYEQVGNTLKGYEYNGVLAFNGTFNELEFKIENPEFWHGFNVGAEAPVPEPSSMIFGAMGIAGLLGIKRKKK